MRLETAVPRASGFYWVKTEHEGWIVAQWYVRPENLGGGGCWFLPGLATSFADGVFIEINQRRITRAIQPKQGIFYD